MDEEHKLAVVLFADIAGYTSLMQQDEKKALHTLTMFKKALQVATSGHTGKIVQYFGDGCLMTFESAVNALYCAIALYNDFTSTDVPVRIGLHLGDIVYKEGNAFGDGVNLASRVESMGVPGAVLMSKTLRDQIKNKKEYVLESMGTYQFKNVDEVIEIFALANPGFKIPVKGEMTGKLAPEYSSNKRRLQSLAVLPFVNYSGDSKQNFFVDGMHDAVIAEVARITQLNVISRTSVLKFKDTSLSIPEIA